MKQNRKHARVEDGHGCAQQPATSHMLGIDISLVIGVNFCLAVLGIYF